MLDRCRDHRCLTKCYKQYRQNEPDGQVDDPTRVEICVMGISATCRNHRHLNTCQKQQRRNEPAGQVDDPIREEFYVTGDARHM